MKITSIGTILLRLPYRQSGPPAGFGGRVWTPLHLDGELTDARGITTVPDKPASVATLVLW